MTKYDHLAITAQNSVQAALLAQRGFTGDPTVPDGDRGFWRFAGGSGYDPDAIRGGLGETWMSAQTHFKRYPASLNTQPAIELLRAMQSSAGFTPESVEAIQIQGSRPGLLEMRSDIGQPYEAWASYAYTVAAGLCHITPRHTWFDPAVFASRRLNGLRRKITVTPLQDRQLLDAGNRWDGFCPAVASVTAGGRVFDGTADRLPILTDDELSAKFLENAAHTTDPHGLLSAAWSIRHAPAVSAITGLLPR